MISDMICGKEDTLFSVIKKINGNGKGAAFIIDEKSRLYGVVTDGDIRRLLLDGHTLGAKVSDISKRTFVYVKTGELADQILAKLTDKIKIVPIVDEDMKVVDFIENRRDVRIPVAEPNLVGNELAYLIDAFLSTWISNKGDYIKKFETNFPKFCSCKYGVATSNGTVAIHLALEALGIKEGDEVIVPALTFAATINAVLHAKARPVIVDIEEKSWCIDPIEIKRAITSRTKAVIPVHLYGQPCDMSAIMSIARANGLYVIEDCAEAHGARYAGRMVGSFGDIGCFSFYGNKIITTGEGGMCVTNDDNLDRRMRMLRDHGMSHIKKYWHEAVGYNYRLTNLQAAIGVAQLERIDDILRKRKEVEDEYKKHLADCCSVEFQRDDLPAREKITWLVSVLVRGEERDRYLEELNKNEIDARPLFYSLSAMDIYKKFTFSDKVSLSISKRGISLPTKLNLSKETFGKVKKIFCGKD